MIGHVLTAAALVFSQGAQRQCITRDQAADLAVVLLPEVVNSMAQQCATHLPESAFLRSGVNAYLQQLRTEAAARRASAMSAFGALTNGQLPQGVSPEAALSGMSSGMMAQSMSGRMNAQTCPEIDRFMQALSPLPASSWATMVSSGIGIALAMRPAPAPAAGQGNRQGANGASAPAQPFGPFCPQ